MNTDAFFTIGHTHTVCQDYAAAISPEEIVLSDGCSSSQHTDIGARLLCRRAAAHDIEQAPFAVEPLLPMLNLPVECLDATLLVAKLVENTVQVSVCGDGVVVGRKRTGGYVMFLLEFPTGAPRYISYDLNPNRRTRYTQEFAGDWEVSVSNERGSLGKEIILLEDKPLVPFHAAFPVAEFDLVLLLSDGATSFHRPRGTNGATEAVPLMEIIHEMLSVKGYAGQFITRRARRFLKEAAAKGWAHDDDFSVAALYLGDLTVQNPIPTA